MPVLTIHALDAEVERRIRDRARAEHKSLNQTMKELLAASVGMAGTKPFDHRADFAEFAGIWTADEAADFEKATAEFSVIDEKDWE